MNLLVSIKSYFSLVKFSHTIFAMPFALVGFVLGMKQSQITFDGFLLLEIVLCMVFARNAAMAFNRLVDWRFDKLNNRTANREIPAGVIPPKKALFFVLLNALFFSVTTYFINSLVFALSPVALGVILGYSYTKRFTALCHLILGIGLSLAPIGAFLAVTGQFNHILPILFSFTVLFWVTGFDIIYALQDEEFDKSNQLHSIPSLVGKKRALQLSNILHLITIILIVFIGLFFMKDLFYWIGASLFIGILIYQHTLVKPTDLSKITLAFATLNGVGSVLYCTFIITHLLIY